MTAPTPRPGDGTRVFMIDNYDSFTYNLVQFLGELGADITVKRNDHVTIAEIEAAEPTHLVVSPGPCTPNEAGISMDAIAHFGAARLPVLGVCLGHQAIGQAFGGVVRRAGAPVHGKTDQIHHAGAGVFAGLPDPFTATRYHSLVVDEDLPECLALTAWNEEGIVMGVGHRDLPVHGVQFHPESVLTEVGLDLLATFLRLTGAHCGAEAPASTDGAAGEAAYEAGAGGAEERRAE
jgi:anthranilate synthase/aminodeoxychorismate synthase-like glutamine amidotransferase